MSDQILPATNVAFVGALCEQFPVLIPLLQTHLDAYEALLPHLFLGEVTPWLVERYVENPTDETTLGILRFIDTAFASAAGDRYELIAASFLENLPRKTEPGADIRVALGSSLRDWVDRNRDY